MTEEKHDKKYHNEPAEGGLLIKFLNEGTLSIRYLLTSKNQTDFAKVFRAGEDCYGRASREIIKNEIAVMEYITKSPPSQPTGDSDDVAASLSAVHQYASQLGYRGYRETFGVTTLLFEDRINWRDGNSTLEEKIGVTSEKISRSDEIPTTMEILQTKRSVQAERSGVYNVNEVINIVRQIAEQAQCYHNLKYKDETDQKLGRGGIIHMDITPKNIIIYDQITRIGGEDYHEKKVLLIDFGIARENGKSIDKLYNNAKIIGVNNDYYSSPLGIFNLIYSPITYLGGKQVKSKNGDDAEQKYIATPEYDTYNIINILCLMLTGRLVEYWEQTAVEKVQNQDKENTETHQTGSRNTLLEILKDNISDRLNGENFEDDKKIAVSTALARMIACGPKDKESQSASYGSCKEIIGELDNLKVPVPRQKVMHVTAPIMVPKVFSEYMIGPPKAFEKSLKSRWENLMEQAITVEDTVNIPERYWFKDLEIAVSRAQDEQERFELLKQARADSKSQESGFLKSVAKRFSSGEVIPRRTKRAELAIATSADNGPLETRPAARFHHTSDGLEEIVAFDQGILDEENRRMKISRITGASLFGIAITYIIAAGYTFNWFSWPDLSGLLDVITKSWE